MDKSRKINIDGMLTIVAVFLAFVSVVSVLCFVIIGKNVTPAMKEFDSIYSNRRDGYYTFVIAGLVSLRNTMAAIPITTTILISPAKRLVNPSAK